VQGITQRNEPRLHFCVRIKSVLRCGGQVGYFWQPTLKVRSQPFTHSFFFIQPKRWLQYSHPTAARACHELIQSFISCFSKIHCNIILPYTPNSHMCSWHLTNIFVYSSHFLQVRAECSRAVVFNLFCSRTPRYNFSSTLYPQSSLCIIPVIHSI
jgi:hypothetical protein